MTRDRTKKRPSEQPYVLRLPSDLHRELMLYKTLRRRPLNDVLLDLIQTWWQAQTERQAVLALIRKAGS